MIEKSKWYEDWFASDHYLKLYSNRNQNEAKKAISLIYSFLNINDRIKVLDLACGAGRHSIELAKKNAIVTGVDLSSNLLKIAINDSLAEKLDITYLLSDMRNITFENEFRLIVQLFTSFGYFDCIEDDKLVLANNFRALEIGGFYILDLINKNYLLNNLVSNSIKKIEDLEVVEKRYIIDDFVVKEINLKSPIKEINFNEKVRLYSMNQILDLLLEIGFDSVKLFGDYDGIEYDQNKSERMILISRKNKK